MSPVHEEPLGEKSGRVAVAADLGGTKCHAVLVAPSGRVLAEDHRWTAELSEPADVLLASLSALHATARARQLEVAAVAVGVPGAVDRSSGIVTHAVNLGWDSFDLGACLEQAFGAPCLVENDVNLAALGEAASGAGRGVGSFATIALGTGLGGAVVLGGHLVRGHHNAAGEFGFLMASRRQFHTGSLMGMESVLGGPSIVARARQLAAEATAGAQLGRTPAKATDVLDAARRGDPIALRVVAEVLEHLAMTVVDICAVLDVQRVVLDGSIGRSLTPELPRLVELVDRALMERPEIVVSTLAPTAALAGAIAEARRVLEAE